MNMGVGRDLEVCVCVRAYVCACMRVCVHACVRVCVGGGGRIGLELKQTILSLLFYELQR